jgi:tetratricopeptide (TPR) repeat protein
VSAATPGSRSRGLILLLPAAVLAFGLYAWEFAHRLPWLSHPVADARIYEAWAQAIAQGDFLGSGVFYRAPLYPYVLALWHALLAPEAARVAMVALQVLAGALTVLMLARASGRLFGSAAGWITGASLLFYAPLPFFATKLVPTSLVLLLETLTLLVLLGAVARSGFRRFLVAGLLGGLYALSRPSALLFLAASFLLGWAGDRGRRRRWWAVPLGVFLVVAPVTARNVLVGGDLVLIASNAGMTFYQGNNAGCRTGLMNLPEEMAPLASAPRQEEMEIRFTRRETGRELRPSERSRYWFARGLAFWREQPLRALRLVGWKLLRALGSWEPPNNYSVALERELLLSAKLFAVPFALFLILGVWGLGAGWRRPEVRWVLLPALGSVLAVCLLFFVTSRYRLELVPPLALLSGAGAVRAGTWLRERRVPTIPLLLAPLLLLPSVLVPRAAGPESVVWMHLGWAWLQEGEIQKARTAYEEALRRQPGNPYARARLAETLTKSGELEEAASLLGFRGAASRHPVLLVAQARLRAARGDTVSARVALTEARRRRPGLLPAWWESLRLELVAGRVASAEEILGKIPAAARAFPRARLARAALEALRGDRERAAEDLRQLRSGSDPALERARLGLLAALLGPGAVADTLGPPSVRDAEEGKTVLGWILAGTPAAEIPQGRLRYLWNEFRAWIPPSMLKKRIR